MAPQRRILVTGASGFIGSHLVNLLRTRGLVVRELLRRVPDRESVDRANAEPLSERCIVPTLSDPYALRSAVKGVDVVIHLAGRVHVMNDESPNPLAEYRRVNVDGTVALARAAAAAGVSRFIYLSSILVNGDCTDGVPFREDQSPHPTRPYAISKWEAEQTLSAFAQRTALEVTIVRPPLVYGPGVKANFMRLLHAIARGKILPLGMLSNRRSLLYVGNLADFLYRCTFHPASTGETFLVRDREVVSVAELAHSIGAAAGRPARLLPVPIPILRLIGWGIGRQTDINRLIRPLEIDMSKVGRVLGWMPPFSIVDGLSDTAHWYQSLAAQ